MYASIAHDKIHGHVEGVVDIAFKAHARLEGEGQHAGAGLVGIGPDFRTEGEEAIGLAFEEGRVGKQRGGDGLQGQRNAELLHHVGFGAEIQIDLHGAGPEHHVAAIAANLVHVGRHDLVAALGHDRGFGARPGGRGAEAEKSDAQRIADFPDLDQMLIHFFAGIVDGLEGSAGKFKLAARFQRNIAHSLGITQGNDLVILIDALPAKAVAQAFEKGADGAGAVIGHGLQRIGEERKFFVLGADAPVRLRLCSPCSGPPMSWALFSIGARASWVSGLGPLTVSILVADLPWI